MNIYLSEDIKKILNLSKRLFITGGFVRDSILGIETLDVDMAYDGAIEDIYDKVSDITTKVRLNPKFFGLSFEYSRYSFTITSFREDIFDKEKKSYSFIRSNIEKDVERRDFTINSLYFRDKIIDLKDGTIDLEKKILRKVASFEEDPARVIRALRFSLAYNLSFEKTTKLEIKKIFPKLSCYFRGIPSEFFSNSQNARIYKELNILKSKGLLSKALEIASS